MEYKPLPKPRSPTLEKHSFLLKSYPLDKRLKIDVIASKELDPSNREFARNVRLFALLAKEYLYQGKCDMFLELYRTYKKWHTGGGWEEVEGKRDDPKGRSIHFAIFASEMAIVDKVVNRLLDENKWSIIELILDMPPRKMGVLEIKYFSEEDLLRKLFEREEYGMIRELIALSKYGFNQKSVGYGAYLEYRRNFDSGYMEIAEKIKTQGFFTEMQAIAFSGIYESRDTPGDSGWL